MLARHRLFFRLHARVDGPGVGGMTAVVGGDLHGRGGRYRHTRGDGSAHGGARWRPVATERNASLCTAK